MDLAERHTVGDVIQAQHPLLAVLLTGLVIVGAALAAIGGIACLFSDEKLPQRIAWTGIALITLGAVGILGAVFVVVFPALGIGILCLVAVGVALGLYLRRQAQRHHV